MSFLKPCGDINNIFVPNSNKVPFAPKNDNVMNFHKFLRLVFTWLFDILRDSR